MANGDKKHKTFAVVGYHSSPYQIVVDEVHALGGDAAIARIGNVVPDRKSSDYSALVAIEIPPGVELKYTFNTKLEA